MQLSRDLPLPNSLGAHWHVPDNTRGSVVTLGNFDGVHLGHQALIKALHLLARPQHLTVQVVTVTPHPRDYFAAQGRGTPVLHIGSVRDRVTRLTALGVNGVHLLRFNHALATLSPHDFVVQVLVGACRAQHVVVGRDVRFGHQRAGDLTLLLSLGERYGFTVHAFDEILSPVLHHAHQRIASSTVRNALQAGNIAAANALLGYDYSISGRVIHGRKLGRTLGCPTLNLIPRMANPAFRGIAVVAIEGLNGLNGLSNLSDLNGRRCYGVASLGLRPTVEQTTRYSLEVHAFDWSGDAYGKRVTITFLHKLRDEAAYIDLPTLQTAIEQDMLDARDWLSQHALI